MVPLHLAYVQWYSKLTEPEPNHGMFKIRPQKDAEGQPMIPTDFHDSWPSRLQKNPVLMGQPTSADSKDSSIIHWSADTGVDRRDFAPEIIFKEM